MKSALLKHSIDKPLAMVTHGKGIFLYDDQGRDYIDGSSGAMTANIGHGVTEIAAEQAERVAFAFRMQFTNGPAEELAARIANLAPGDLNSVFFVNSGSEASECAIRVALQYWKEQGRPEKVKVLGRKISYHGMTMGALSLSGHTGRRVDYGPLLHPFPVAPPAYAYRFSIDGNNTEAYAAAAAQAFEDAIIEQGVESVAAVIAEPIVGAAGGVLVPPPGYFKRLREICDRLDILLILDEVITGLGRTGAWFAASDEGIDPDIILTGKGTSAGYTPMAAVIIREKIVDAMRAGSGYATLGHTFSANPLSAAVCLAVLDYVERENLLENTRVRGEELRQGLEALSQRYRHMVDVRGRGLLWGFEFVLDRSTKKAPPSQRSASAVFVQECFDEGLIVYPAGIAPLNNAIIVSPPLIITRDEVQELLRRLDKALAKMELAMNAWTETEAEIHLA
ncbi:aminotransferase class III-fold pyridoxal phosphate-dependent enzyme [Shinella sp.]|uniref:aminotransferase class III-fold pyridoxal phosphate-dependent enzyme n=1 Tax=Shinella sp. TaxID=1870904 RepID=UPI0029A2F5D1|nr:aminotransferase class III-fold pyridoxal phosphate-dependent enzyme [Shinella sp.]MDX3975011.1 aminotransferase class III-fold pyridoxal phosphate-dependent enzyme [Shinella sp.]